MWLLSLFLMPFGNQRDLRVAKTMTKTGGGFTLIISNAELRMPNQGTESQFEETTIDRLRAIGYRYQYGGDIERDWRDVVMTDWLRAFLQKKYPKLPEDALK